MSVEGIKSLYIDDFKNDINSRIIDDVEDEIYYLESRIKMFRKLYIMLLNEESEVTK